MFEFLAGALIMLLGVLMGVAIATPKKGQDEVKRETESGSS